MEKRKQLACTSAAAAVIWLMIGAAIVFKDKEIIFPEIAALTTGVFLTPKLLWKDTGPVKFTALMTLSAFFGIALTSFFHIPVIFRIILGCAFTVICLSIFRSGLYPMLSACILPAILDISSLVYPVSVFCCCVAIVLLRNILGKIFSDNGFAEIKTDTNYFSRSELLPKIIGSAIIIIYAVIPCRIHRPMLIAPPLFVLFMELFTDSSKLKGRELSALFTAVFCCFTGSYTVYLLSPAGIPGIAAAAVIITVIIFTLFKTVGIYLPPIAALSYLPLILPVENLPVFPLYTGISLTVSILFIMLVRHLGKN